MGITQHEVLKKENKLLKKRIKIMELGQKPSEKEAKKIYEIEKVMALTVFKKYYPNASIVFNEPKPIEEVVVEEEPKGPSEEELLAIKLEEEKAAKKAELEAQLAALNDES